jgi:hypothetical protein
LSDCFKNPAILLLKEEEEEDKKDNNNNRGQWDIDKWRDT